MIRRLILLLFLFRGFNSTGATVDSVMIYSKAMQKEFRCVVIIPIETQNKTVPFPVVYLLHGFSGSCNNWINHLPELKQYADEYKMMIVCPDGGYSSWYIDSPVDSTIKYETYISKEVPLYIESNYPVFQQRNGRAVTG